jgi:phosphatidylinositol alpha-1,6-mannosyltransferase
MLLSVGRLQRRKGHDLAIAAIDTLRHDLPGLRYVIVGDGEERGRLERMVADRDLGGHVTFRGAVPSGELPAYFSACDVFLLPNRIDQGDIEGFGIVFLEAAAAERPVIAGNTGGVPEAVADGFTGLLVSGTCVDELARAIRRMAGDKPLRLRFGRAGRERVLRSFSWGAAAERVRAVHDAVRSGR